MSRIGNVYGVVSLKHWLMRPNGEQFNKVFGFIVVTTDKELSEDFRSSERWQLSVYASKRHATENCKVPVVMVPGCCVAGIVFCSPKISYRSEIYDVTI